MDKIRTRSRKAPDIKVKQFYSCTDVTMPAPQPEQHLAANKKASLENGQIISYGAEDIINFKNQMFILDKVQKIIKNIDGVVFFTVDQFCYSETINLKLLKNLIDHKLEVHFSRENISIYNPNDFEKIADSLLSYFFARSLSVQSTIYKMASFQSNINFKE